MIDYGEFRGNLSKREVFEFAIVYLIGVSNHILPQVSSFCADIHLDKANKMNAEEAIEE